MKNRLLDKAILLTLCLALYLPREHALPTVAPFLLIVAVSALNSLLETRTVTAPVFAGFCAVSAAWPDFLFFLPLVGYDLRSTGPGWGIFFSALPVAADLRVLPPAATLPIALLVALAALLEHRTRSLESLRREFSSLRDSARELSLRMDEKNKDLMERQDYEVRLATLGERNRIAREIHDTVGHLLTSSILQLGALLATCRDETLRGGLQTLKTTLTQGMDSIRCSIHDLHEESVDLETEVDTLIDGFTFCPVTLQYDINGNPEKAVKYAFIAILKESLSNIVRHSRATAVSVTLREHPGLYQLIVRDNGTGASGDGGGIGLENIRQRVESLHGHLNIRAEKGFELFISIPKGNEF